MLGSSSSSAAAAAAAFSSTPSNSSSSPHGSTASASETREQQQQQQQQPSNAPLAPPWTPTSQLRKRKTYQKRGRFLIQTLEAEQRAALAEGKALPAFRSGDILEVTTVVREAEGKAYTYRGVCIARANKGPRSWFKLYNVFPDAGGFVQHFPLYMPDLASVKVVGRLPRARRSKLYHLLQQEGPQHVYQTGVQVQRTEPS